MPAYLQADFGTYISHRNQNRRLRLRFVSAAFCIVRSSVLHAKRLLLALSKAVFGFLADFKRKALAKHAFSLTKWH